MPSSATTTSSVPADRSSAHHDLAGGPGVEGVRQRVVHQLGEHQHQRGGQRGGQGAEAAVAAHLGPRLGRGPVADHRQHLVDQLVEVDPFGDRRRTATRAPARSSSPAARSPRAPGGPPGSPCARACSRSSAATVCRLFFTRWWISRIVASLLSRARSRRRRSVTSRTSTSAPAASPRGPQRQRAHQHHRAAGRAPPSAASACPSSAASIRAATSAASNGSAHQLAGRVGQRQPDEVAGVAHPVVGRQRVRAGVGDEAVRVEPDQAVAGARAGVGARRRPRGGGNVPSATIWQRSDALPR